ncbi:MAG: restriction endonuclease [Bacilli bacterium]
MINWESISSVHFEKFVYYLLGKLGFMNRKWHGKGGNDRGRDIIATREEVLPFHFAYTRTWVFQCKRWRTFPTPHVILSEIAMALQHKPDFWVLVVTVNPTSAQYDYMDALNGQFACKVLLLPLVVIEELMAAHPESVNILLNGSLSERSEV